MRYLVSKLGVLWVKSRLENKKLDESVRRYYIRAEFPDDAWDFFKMFIGFGGGLFLLIFVIALSANAEVFRSLILEGVLLFCSIAIIGLLVSGVIALRGLKPYIEV